MTYDEFTDRYGTSNADSLYYKVANADKIELIARYGAIYSQANLDSNAEELNQVGQQLDELWQEYN